MPACVGLGGGKKVEFGAGLPRLAILAKPFVHLFRLRCRALVRLR